jgi:hypothetical protein
MADPEGLLVQVVENQEIMLAMLDEDGSLNHTTMEVPLLRKDRYFDLHFNGPRWGTATMKVELHPNGSLKNYSVKREPGTAEAIQKISDVTASLSETIAAIDKANDPEPEEPADPIAELQAEILKMMLERNKQDIEAGLEPTFPEIIGLEP